MRNASASAAAANLARLTGNLRQLAAVRRITLEDGPARGLRALAFSTGGGLDFWVFEDRAMDIGPVWFAGTPIAFEHPNGYVARGIVSPEDDDGTGVERLVSGFLVTCGLEHVRQPAPGRPLHGTMTLMPARLTAHGEDWDAAEPVLFAEGEVVSAHLNGASFRLRRRITAPIGGRRLTIADRIENIGTAPQELGVLHHFNFGFPAVNDGTTVRLNGAPVLTVGAVDAAAVPTVACHAAGPGPRVLAELIRPPAPPWPGLRVSLSSDALAQPFVQLWTDRRPRRNVLAIEPVTSDRGPGRTSQPGPVLAPGERWHTTHDVRFDHPRG